MAETAEDETQTLSIKAILEHLDPLKVDGETLVPVRLFYSYFGSEIEWNSKKASTIINYEDKNIKISNLSNEIEINGVNHTSEVPVKCIDGKMYLELSLAANSLGYEASLIENNNTIIAIKDNVSAEQLENFKQVSLSALEAEADLKKEIALEPKVSFSEKGTASWYGGALHGCKTASGERFNQYAYTAAHKTLPFGTIVKVTSLRTGKSVDVKITDRGPFTRGRVIDLSMAAADSIGIKRSGIGPVQLEVFK